MGILLAFNASMSQQDRFVKKSGLTAPPDALKIPLLLRV